MYYTYVVRPGDAPEGKGPGFKPFWDGMMQFNLRGGLLLQLIGYTALLVSSVLGQNGVQIAHTIGGNSDYLKSAPIIILFIGTFLFTAGAVCVQNFRNIADDDASIKQSRGFRAGLKALHQASLLDILSWAMTTVLLFSYIQYFEDEFAKNNMASGSTALYASTARVVHAFSLFSYAISFFMIECFHQQGTGEYWGWIIAACYKAAATFEILSLVSGSNALGTVCDFIFSVFFLLGLLSAFIWACALEPLVGNTEVKLTQSAVCNEYYKSRHSTAYYGPPADI